MKVSCFSVELNCLLTPRTIVDNHQIFNFWWKAVLQCHSPFCNTVIAGGAGLSQLTIP